jgi:FixJ family two-component response regulator
MSRLPEYPASHIYIVEDDDAVRDSLRMILESIGHNVKAFPDANSFLANYHENLAGCMVLDIRMPGMTGMELQRKLNDMNSILPIIFVTGHGDVQMAVEAMQQGAADFIEKPYREQDLLEKITQALTLDTKNRESLKQQKTIIEQVKKLTPRERQVMKEMVHGKANKIIATDLAISQRTVEIHRARVMEKLNACSLAHLVRLYMTAEPDLQLLLEQKA